VLLPLLVLIVGIGVFPSAFTGKTEATISALIAQVQSKASVALLR
jgi:NADH:ubiquinone oxidoreductase subunit 4 (subunit M)